MCAGVKKLASKLRSNTLFAKVGYLLAVLRSLLLTTLLRYCFCDTAAAKSVTGTARVAAFCEGSGEVTKVATGAMQNGDVAEVASSLLPRRLEYCFCEGC